MATTIKTETLDQAFDEAASYGLGDRTLFLVDTRHPEDDDMVWDEQPETIVIDDSVDYMERHSGEEAVQ